MSELRDREIAGQIRHALDAQSLLHLADRVADALAAAVDVGLSGWR